jgi:hypothetical protein
VIPSLSAKYLKEEKKSYKAVRCSLVYRANTVKESLAISSLSMDDGNLLEQSLDVHKEATHVVIGIKWGGRVVATLIDENKSNQDKSRVTGNLKAELEKAIEKVKISGAVNLNSNENSTAAEKNYKFKLNGDVNLSSIPTSYQEMIKVLPEIPNSIKQANNGKGVQLEYINFILLINSATS